MKKPDFNEIILNSVTDGVFTVDSDWRITFFNQAAEKITGVYACEATARMCWDVFRANICESQCALKNTLITGKPVVNKAIFIVNADGKRVPVSISTGILKDENGRMIGGVETFRDLSVVEKLRQELEKNYTVGDMISKNHQMREIFKILPAIAASDCTVLITGPTGTGKELLARAVHNLSPRREKPFIAVNCAALPDTLLESELFGYEAGAFTDARKSKPGRFARAQGGTLFLDEIGDVSPGVQVKLLRVLQEKEYEPLGAIHPVRADVRLLAATNKNLAEAIEKDCFRADLYYRLNVINLNLPSLVERREDIPLLVEHFIDHNNALSEKTISGISGPALNSLMNHDFPGNIRELANAIEHAFVLCPGGLIEPKHLPSYLHSGGNDAVPCTLAGMEAQFIRDALVRNNWKRVAVAKELGIDKSTLWRKMKQYNIRAEISSP
ncbi:sigma-54 interaction domain-containing protein [Desulfotomaculum copahuensis]|uniref:Fis family transcriptional regulator n=1 Tax=Desulfotomaculum copahuensis TaxID=1838280 RepID=A0A1B7LB54_9FIRM|nr:sigma 54-interacting transcriptional regulator [Desulfotomaculum copahuensis]OAT79540.1 Fis family transcriptional regulator [Desulfotomaculum copahuensis]